MRAHRITLAVISAVLVGEGYLLVDRYLIPHVPLHFADWSRHTLTSDEQHQLFDELRMQLMGITDASTGVVLSGLTRSVADPKKVCGLLKRKGSKGEWGSWNEFDITFLSSGPFLSGVVRDDEFLRIEYLRDGIYRLLQQSDHVACS